MDKENMQYMDSLKKRVLEFLLPKGEIVDVIIENQVEDSVVFKKDFPLSINIVRNILVGEFFGQEIDTITDEKLKESFDIILDKHVKDYSDDDERVFEKIVKEEIEEETKPKSIKFIILNDWGLNQTEIEKINERLQEILTELGIFLDGTGFDLVTETKEYYYK